ncbi:uncharacterized protein DUF1533 [Salsuginibacillus halophilus]|uniref:Uncharacterized protein DUF1533 n=1 Tax=Salsuginibacillus halophilus TaxID=517424 RepID=A0A2P8H1Y8_9BACI|nr:hemoblobin-interacting domain-containing protein [Salsuginibacillus halophilus]PSL40233.1 uncharacterized protein DUF1533 [Salsuginibacillus halophilus]
MQYTTLTADSVDSDLEITFNGDELTADYQNAVTAVELDNDNGTEITVSEEDYDFNVDSGDTTLTIDEGVVENADEYDLTIVADNYEDITEDELEVVEGSVSASESSLDDGSYDGGDEKLTLTATVKDNYGNQITDLTSGEVDSITIDGDDAEHVDGDFNHEGDGVYTIVVGNGNTADLSSEPADDDEIVVTINGEDFTVDYGDIK